MKHGGMRYIGFVTVTTLLLFGLSAQASQGHAAGLTNLRCEYLDNPLGIDAAKPRLSWVIEERGQRSEVRGQKQSAYQVLVASTPELLAADRGLSLIHI